VRLGKPVLGGQLMRIDLLHYSHARANPHSGEPLLCQNPLAVSQVCVNVAFTPMPNFVGLSEHCIWKSCLEHEMEYVDIALHIPEEESLWTCQVLHSLRSNAYSVLQKDQEHVCYAAALTQVIGA
jgi:hypothetical protein